MVITGVITVISDANNTKLFGENDRKLILTRHRLTVGITFSELLNEYGTVTLFSNMTSYYKNQTTVMYLFNSKRETRVFI